MTQNRFFVIVAIVTVLFGLGFLFMPNSALSWYGAATDPVGLLMSRVFGSAAIGLAVVYFMARDQAVGTTLTGLLWAGLITNVLDLVLAVVATSGGLLSALGWGQALLHILLGAGFAYLLFGKPAQA